MQDNINNDSLKNIFIEIKNELTTVAEGHEIYSRSLSGTNGISFSADKKEKKELAICFYRYASILAEGISNMERPISGLTDIIISADRDGQQNKLLLCDSLLTQFGEFKMSTSLFVSKSEQILANEDPSPAHLRKLLFEYGYKLNYFNDFLTKQSF